MFFVILLLFNILNKSASQIITVWFSNGGKQNREEKEKEKEKEKKKKKNRKENVKEKEKK